MISRILSAWVFLDGSTARVARRPPEAYAGLAWLTMLIGALWGLVMIGLWDASFRLTWPVTFNWVVPSAVCAAAMALGPYRQATLSLAEILTRHRRLAWLGPPLAAMVVGLALNASFRFDDDWTTLLPQQWAWLWPRALYRMLLLTPVWGAWATLVLGRFCRPDERTDDATRRFAETVHPITTAVTLAIPLAGSLVCLNFLYPLHFVPPLTAMVAALGGGFLLVRLAGGLTRQTLLAANVLTQLAFLLAYLIVR